MDSERVVRDERSFFNKQYAWNNYRTTTWQCYFYSARKNKDSEQGLMTESI